jgi:hypothetical protein
MGATNKMYNLSPLQSGELSKLSIKNDECNTYENFQELYRSGNCDTNYKGKKSLFNEELEVLTCGLIVLKSQVELFQNLDKGNLLYHDVKKVMSIGKFFRPLRALSAKPSRYAPFLMVPAKETVASFTKSEEDGTSLPIINSVNELKEGEVLIYKEKEGRYCGLRTMDVGGEKNDYITLEQDRGAKVFVPVSSITILSRLTDMLEHIEPLLEETVFTLLKYDESIPYTITNEFDLDIIFKNRIDGIDSNSSFIDPVVLDRDEVHFKIKSAEKLLAELEHKRLFRFAYDKKKLNLSNNTPNFYSGLTNQGNIAGLLYNIAD